MRGSFPPRCVVLALPLALTSLPLAPALPSQQGSAAVPEEFVRAIFGDAQLLIGELPEDLPEALEWPGEVRIIGTVLSETHATSYLSVSGDPDAVVTFVRARMIEAGWRTPPERERPSGGFQRPQRETASATFCGPAEEVLTVSAEHRDGDTLVHVLFHTSYPSTVPCDRSGPPARASRRNDLRERMPTLMLSPDEAEGSMGGGSSMGGTGSSAWSTAELSTERTPTQIAADIAEQLEAEDWTPIFTADGDNEAVRTWTKTFEDGARYRGLLLVTALASDRYETMFQIRTVVDARRP